MSVTILADGSVRIEGDGCGIPVERDDEVSEALDRERNSLEVWRQLFTLECSCRRQTVVPTLWRA